MKGSPKYCQVGHAYFYQNIPSDHKNSEVFRWKKQLLKDVHWNMGKNLIKEVMELLKLVLGF